MVPNSSRARVVFTRCTGRTGLLNNRGILPQGRNTVNCAATGVVCERLCLSRSPAGGAPPAPQRGPATARGAVAGPLWGLGPLAPAGCGAAPHAFLSTHLQAVRPLLLRKGHGLHL